jgi:glutamate formiminotransferase / formiminotetrahydrofolate cyclodeaminase
VKSKLIECVPNFSEGRDKQKIGGIVDAIGSVGGVRVLHVDSGATANRTVVTFAGEADAVEEAAFVGIAKAADVIDMSTHSGTHPRIGATDVCPFVPIGESEMEDCIGVSHRVGERVGTSLGVPVYLYAESARYEGRRNLPTLRQGEYEGLAEKLRRSEFEPDFGAATFNARSGATVLGARRFLIAWNVNLDTKDPTIARTIARKLRTSGQRGPDGSRSPGRFRGLQGDGWFIKEFDRAQITFNILDYQTTPIASVYEACKEEASALGVRVTGSEMVGLIPADALAEAGRFYANSGGRDDAEPIALAVKELGLDELNPFDPKRRVLEYAYEAAR